MMRAALLAFALLMLPLAAHAALTEEEKKLLLQATVSRDGATELGRKADAAGLERIIGLGDPGLVQSFDYGMRQARIEVLPPAIEALVAAHFDDPKVGAALRALTPRYQTRRLFDLHYARIQGTYRADEPSFAQILRTDQAGIEEALLRAAPKFASPRGEGNAALMFLGRRKHPGAVPGLLAILGQDQYALGVLLEYPSVDVWRQASIEIERLRGDGKLDERRYAQARKQLDPYLNDPERHLQAMRSRDAFAVYARERDAIAPSAAQLAPLRDQDPQRYAAAMAEYIAQLEPLAARSGDDRVQLEVGAEYYRLGMFLRLRLHDPAAAVAPLTKAARYRHMVGQIALADLYQFELHDKEAAIRAYQVALDEAAAAKSAGYTPYAQPGSRMNAWWRAWLAYEIEYLRSGRRFNGRVAEEVVGGFFQAVSVNAVMVTGYVAPDIPRIAGAGPGPAWPSQPLMGVGDWAGVEGALARIDRRDVAAKLEKLPPSRLVLMATLSHVSALPSSQAILAYLERHDPSGYWSTCLLGAVAYYQSKGLAGRDEALATGTAQLLPGMADAAKPNPLGDAAGRFLKTRGLRVVAKP